MCGLSGLGKNSFMPTGLVEEKHLRCETEFSRTRRIVPDRHAFEAIGVEERYLRVSRVEC